MRSRRTGFVWGAIVVVVVSSLTLVAGCPARPLKHHVWVVINVYDAENGTPHVKRPQVGVCGPIFTSRTGKQAKAGVVAESAVIDGQPYWGLRVYSGRNGTDRQTICQVYCSDRFCSAGFRVYLKTGVPCRLKIEGLAGHGVYNAATGRVLSLPHTFEKGEYRLRVLPSS